MCEVTRYFQTPPHLEIAKFSQNLPSPGALSTLCTVVKHLKNAIQGFRGALDLNYFEHAAWYQLLKVGYPSHLSNRPMHELCLCWPFRLEFSSTLPAPGITVPLISPTAEMT